MEKYDVVMRWAAIYSRCKNPNNNRYQDYGGRGIHLDGQWEDFDNFYEWCKINGLEKGLVIDRIDNDGPYSPDNCRVVTQKQNAQNTRRSRHLEAFGETKTMAAWTEDPRCLVSDTAFKKRIRSGWTVEDALKTLDPREIEAFGERKRLSAWATDDRCVVSFQTLKDRFYSHSWTAEKAMTTPVGESRGKNRKDNINLDAFGETKTLGEWGKDPRCRVNYGTLHNRVKSGWSAEKAISTPPRPLRKV